MGCSWWHCEDINLLSGVRLVGTVGVGLRGQCVVTMRYVWEEM